MADGTTLPVGGGGDKIDTEDLGARGKIPRGKIALGGLDVDGGDVTVANPLPVQLTDTVQIIGVQAHPVRTDPTGTTTQPVSGTFWQATQPVSLADGADAAFGAEADAAAATDTATASYLSLFKRFLQRVTALLGQLPAALTGSGNLKTALVESTATVTISGTVTANAGSGTLATSDAHLPAAAALSDSLANPTTTAVGANLLGWDGTNAVWRRVQVDAGTGTVKVDGSGSTQPVSQAGSWSVRAQDGSGNALTSAARGAQQALSVQIVDGSGNQVTTFGGSGGTASNYGSAFPTSGTAGGFSDGANMQGARVFDADTGAGTQYVLGVNLRRSASGGSAELLGQATMANSLPVALASDQGNVPTDDVNFPTAAALSDAIANPTVTLVGAPLLLWDATNAVWRRATCDPGSGALLTLEATSGNRSSVCLVWEGVTNATTESALTNFTSGSRGGAALTAANQYTVTANKTLRIKSVNLALNPGTTAAVNRVRVRIRQGNPVANSSPIIWEGVIAASTTESTVSGGYTTNYPIPDGLEVPGGQQITVTWIAATATNPGTTDIVLNGYEY